MKTDAKVLMESAEAPLDDIERQLSLRPSASTFDILDGQFNAVTRLVEDVEASEVPASDAERLARVKNRLETAGVTFVNYVNETEPFDPWDADDD
jgi:hypothetical protein